MAKYTKEKHSQPLPTARGIRRSCNKELYRTIKRLKIWVPPDKVREAEQLYFRKVVGNLLWIHEHRSNRKLLANWFVEEVAKDIADLWEIDAGKLGEAFREAFGG